MDWEMFADNVHYLRIMAESPFGLLALFAAVTLSCLFYAAWSQTRTEKAGQLAKPRVNEGWKP